MSGLFRRPRRARRASPESAAASTRTAAGDATPQTGRPYTEGHADEEVTTVLEPTEGAREDLDALVGAAPTARRRGRLRRRLRHLRRVREVLMRDLGGFLFEVHRSGADRAGDPVVQAKLRRLETVDAELRELEAALGDRRPLVLREAGIGGACPHCGELFGSEARFCWACGTPVAAGAGHVPALLPAYEPTAIAAPAAAPAAAEPAPGDPPVATTPADGVPDRREEALRGDDAAAGEPEQRAEDPGAGEAETLPERERSS